MPADVLDSPATADGAASSRGPRASRGAGCAPSAATSCSTAGAVIVLFPIYVTIVNSLLPPDQLVHQPPPLFPTDPQWHDYSAAWNGGQMSKYMATSAIMTAIIVVGPARDLGAGRLRLRLLDLPVQADALRGLPGHADDPARGHLHHQPRHHHLAALVQHLRGAVDPVPRHRVRHLPAAPGLPADPPRPAGGGPARRLRAHAVHDPGGGAAGPARRWRRWPSSRSSPPGTSTCGRWWRPAGRRRSTPCRSA